MCEGIEDFLSFGISKGARIEDVSEGFSDFWTILEFSTVDEGPKPARKDIPPQPQPQPPYRESLYGESGMNSLLILHIEIEEGIPS